MQIEDIERAQAVLKNIAYRTPLVPSVSIGRMIGADVYLKLENLQKTGSFKIRGAYAALSRIKEASTQALIAAASAGNHAQGVALASKMLGLKATIFMPRNAPLAKQKATASYGAEVRLVGDTVNDCLDAAKLLASDHILIHPFDDEGIIAGQGTIGLEIVEDMPDVEAVVIPIGGGGLIAGIATAVKGKNPETRVIGVEPERAASTLAALAAGRPMTIETRSTLADGARLSCIGDRTWPIIQKLVDDVQAVDDDHIARAMLMLIENRRIVAEGAGALGLAGFLAGKLPRLKGKKVVIVISGGNVDANLLGRIINQGLVRSGRLVRLKVILDDKPGSLAHLLQTIAGASANILHVHHDRFEKYLPLDKTLVDLELETRGSEHMIEVIADLKRNGFVLQEA